MKVVEYLIVVVLSLFSVFGVIAQTQVGPAPILRTLHKKEIERYSVVMDWEGDMGKAHYEFELKLLGELSDDKSPYEKVSATFGHLKASYDGRAAPQTKNFGSAAFRLNPTGFPEGLAIAGANSTFVLPILSWYVPKEPVAADSTFQIADTEFEGNVHVSGSGTYAKGRGQDCTIKLDLSIQTSEKISEAQTGPSGFTSTARINLKTGAVRSSEGEITIPSGRITFRLRRS